MHMISCFVARCDFICPVCGGDVFANAKACPHCGADDRSGWREDADEIDTAAALGIDDPDDFDYESFIEEEFGSGAKQTKTGGEWFWWIVTILVLAAFAALYIFGI